MLHHDMRDISGFPLVMNRSQGRDEMCKGGLYCHMERIKMYGTGKIPAETIFLHTKV